jgi:hypothetical protein
MLEIECSEIFEHENFKAVKFMKNSFLSTEISKMFS